MITIICMVKILQYGGVFRVTQTVKILGEIRDNISQTAQLRNFFYNGRLIRNHMCSIDRH